MVNICDKNLDGYNCFLASALNCSSKDIYEISNFIIDKNKNLINSQDINGNNFLILLENNASIKKNNNTKTIIVKNIIEKSIDINKSNNTGKNILMTIIDSSTYNDWKYLYDYFYFYIQKDINLEHVDVNNVNILEYCIEQMNMEIKLVSKNKIIY